MTDIVEDEYEFQETVIRLLFLIAKQKFGNYNADQRAYMHRLEERIEQYDRIKELNKE